MKLDNIPSAAESSRDFLAACLSVVTQSVAAGISATNTILSVFKKKKTDDYETVLITGASSGIGKALALQFASTKQRRIVLQGRNQDELDNVARSCASHGCQVSTIASDFSKPEDLNAFKEYVTNQDTINPFDLIIANAGMMVHNAEGSIDNTEMHVTDSKFYDAVVDTNIKGVLATFMPLLDRMKERDHGHIVLTSSINAYLGPSNQFLYSATKGFIRILGQDLEQQLHREKSKVVISTVAPGLIDTKMTAPFWDSPRTEDLSSTPRWIAQDAGKFAKKVYKGIVRRDGFITYPYYQFYQSYLGGSLPPTIRKLASCVFTSTGFAGERTT